MQGVAWHGRAQQGQAWQGMVWVNFFTGENDEFFYKIIAKAGRHH